MIAKLTGHVDSLGEDCAVVDVSGVGYLAFCSSRTLGELNPGDAVSLLIETHVREDHIHLYGFMEEGERNWFKLLTTVQGVGAKVALAILSILPVHDLANAIAAGDRAAVTRAPGVGPKLAARVISELKDKAGAAALGAGAGNAAASSASSSGAMPDAISALVNLGYGASEAHAALARAASGLKSKPGESGPSVEVLIRAGLSELGSKEHAR